MKSTRHSSYVPGARSSYHGRHTLERIYRRIAASNVVGTLTARVAKKGHGSRKSARSIKPAASLSAASIQPDHPQSGVLQKRSHQLSQQRLERARSRRKARERQLQKVVENVQSHLLLVAPEYDYILPIDYTGMGAGRTVFRVGRSAQTFQWLTSDAFGSRRDEHRWLGRAIERHWTLETKEIHPSKRYRMFAFGLHSASEYTLLP